MVNPPVRTRGSAVPKARNSNVVLELLKPVQSAGGIILPGREQERVRMGLVVAVGEGILCMTGDRVPVTLAKGDLVAIRPGRGLPFSAGGRVYVVVDQAEIPVVFTTEDGRQLTDPGEVDPAVVRKTADADRSAFAVEDGDRATESADAVPADPADANRPDDEDDGQADEKPAED